MNSARTGEEIVRASEILRGIPDEQQLRSDLRGYYWTVDDDPTRPVHLEVNDGYLELPPECPIEVVRVSLEVVRIGLEFGPLRVEIALGGVESDVCGVIIPRICFARLYYDLAGHLVTIDHYSGRG